MSDRIKIAGVQMDLEITNNRENLDKLIRLLRASAGQGADLVIFPECALSGFVFASRDEALPFMETIPGPATGRVADACRELGVYTVFGLLEKDGEKCFNSCVLIGPGGLIGQYRKSHLPCMGIDRFLNPGQGPYRVYNTALGNIGLFICYDCNFPEVSRSMALEGADILVLPTNWPVGRAKVPNYILVARAYENKVYLAAVNRVGNERGTTFLGRSKILGVFGDTLAEAGENREEIIYAEISPADARRKHTVVTPGEFEVDFFNDRRPELYHRLIERG
ncbi:MAG: carbon-nitrogen hydrolase family protein [Dehalococcoidales bacterium]|nr:carbon-nitrogen hydrolase family protein [Dehalococcoidales bacterium]